MASDNFTDTNGTHLLDHTASITWTAVISSKPDNYTINNNSVRGAAWASANSFASTSTVDSSQVTVLANNPAGVVRPSVRMSSNNAGYMAYFTSLSGGNFTRIEVYKNNAWFARYDSVSYSQASDHTLKITASGTSTVTLEVFVDGSSLGTKTDSSSPIESGYSGFSISMATVGTAQDLLDDWTDGAAGGGSALPNFMYHYMHH